MRVLIACEFSGIVREAFKAQGWDAWSCDLLPTEIPGQHIQGDVQCHLNGWDLIIAHPPCTYLANSGVRWFKTQRERHKLMQDSCAFFAALYWADCPRIAIENPVMHCYARDCLLNAWKVPAHSFTIQPWQFGHGEVKRTCFWTRNLPALKPTNIVPGRAARVHRATPSPDRWKERSRTLPGIAQAMASQWGNLYP